jgi:acylphosphatase
MLNLITRRYLISGRVQGVGFRYFAERAARDSGVTGWIRNLPDGSVEAHATGAPAQIERFEARLRRGPSRSEVTGFEATEDSPSKSTGFEIR